MEDRIMNILKDFGLDEKEINIYTYLVQKGELNAYVLAKLTGIHRSTTYAVIDRLLSAGFITKTEKEGKTFYSAIEITQIIAKMKEKESLLLSLASEFEKIKEKGVSRVRIFESRESQKQFNFNLFNQIKSGNLKQLYILSGGPTGGIESNENISLDLSSGIFLENLLRELNKKHKKIDYKGIWNDNLRKSKVIGLFSGLGEDRFLKDLPTLATTVIFGEYIAYLFTLNGAPQVIEIQNNLIAEESRTYFDYLWKMAKP